CVSAMVAADTVLAVAATDAITGAVVSFPFPTRRSSDLAVLPAASRATAVSVWLPPAAVVVSHAIAYGADVSSAPRTAPSSLNWTPTTPPVSLAFALTEIVPDTVAFAAGAVIDTDGGVASRVVNVKSPEVARLPAASRERAR